ncbi:MAG: hypothetical protein JRN22_02215 [Nitrososphaerota archaeon]|nr:hypothetical protein [Nitrososphaerota archaeon]
MNLFAMIMSFLPWVVREGQDVYTAIEDKQARNAAITDAVSTGLHCYVTQTKGGAHNTASKVAGLLNMPIAANGKTLVDQAIEDIQPAA